MATYNALRLGMAAGHVGRGPETVLTASSLQQGVEVHMTDMSAWPSSTARKWCPCYSTKNKQHLITTIKALTRTYSYWLLYKIAGVCNSVYCLLDLSFSQHPESFLHSALLICMHIRLTIQTTPSEGHQLTMKKVYLQ